MRDKMTVYGLLGKIYNSNTDMPKKINCCGHNYEWDDDYQDYLITDSEKGLLLSFLDNHNDNLHDFLNDTIDIIEEDKKIKKLRLYYSVPNTTEEYNADVFETLCNIIKNQRNQEDKINELIDKINKLKENK